MQGAVTLPFWIQVLQALGTPAIALLAIVIGMMQWRTAHQRAVLDLFDKRWTVLSELRAAVRTVTQENNTVSRETRQVFAAARARAAFLFGPEVTEYLTTILDAMGRLGRWEARTDAEKTIKQQAITEISEFHERSNKLVTPYMRMHQKAPRFPWLD